MATPLSQTSYSELGNRTECLRKMSVRLFPRQFVVGRAGAMTGKVRPGWATGPSVMSLLITFVTGAWRGVAGRGGARCGGAWRGGVGLHTSSPSIKIHRFHFNASSGAKSVSLSAHSRPVLSFVVRREEMRASAPRPPSAPREGNRERRREGKREREREGERERGGERGRERVPNQIRLTYKLSQPSRSPPFPQLPLPLLSECGAQCCDVSQAASLIR